MIFAQHYSTKPVHNVCVKVSDKNYKYAKVFQKIDDEWKHIYYDATLPNWSVDVSAFYNPDQIGYINKVYGVCVLDNEDILAYLGGTYNSPTGRYNLVRFNSNDGSMSKFSSNESSSWDFNIGVVKMEIDTTNSRKIIIPGFYNIYIFNQSGTLHSTITPSLDIYALGVNCIDGICLAYDSNYLYLYAHDDRYSSTRLGLFRINKSSGSTTLFRQFYEYSEANGIVVAKGGSYVYTAYCDLVDSKWTAHLVKFNTSGSVITEKTFDVSEADNDLGYRCYMYGIWADPKDEYVYINTHVGLYKFTTNFELVWYKSDVSGIREGFYAKDGIMYFADSKQVDTEGNTVFWGENVAYTEFYHVNTDVPTVFAVGEEYDRYVRKYTNKAI